MDQLFHQELDSLLILQIKLRRVTEAEMQMMITASVQSRYLERLLDRMTSELEMNQVKKDSLLARLPPVIV